MSRSYKRYPHGYFRAPRGWKKAKLNKVRRGAQPPNAWDDIPHDDQCRVPDRVAYALHRKGWDDDRIVRHLKWKFRLKEFEARAAANYNDIWYRCNCDQCLDRKVRQGRWWSIPYHLREQLKEAS